MAFAASLAVHAVLGGILWGVPRTSIERAPPDLVELTVVDPPTPPPPVSPVAPLPPAPKPLVAAKPVPIKTKPKDAPPPLSSTPPAPTPEPLKPVFGVTPESVLEGPSEVAVPVGNSAAMAPSPTPVVTPKTPLGYAGGALGGTGTAPFAPVPESFVRQWPRTLEEVKAPLPDEARRMDGSGTVRLRVGIDDTGRVKEVKVIKRAGYGLDEAAVKAMWRFRFSPALGQDGKPVPFGINYDYTFAPGT